MSEILTPDAGLPDRDTIRAATNWWNNKGAGIMRLHHLRQAETVGGSNKGAGASFASLDPDSPNFLPSGILAGKPWDDLTSDEQMRVVYHWREHYLIKPNAPEGGV